MKNKFSKKWFSLLLLTLVIFASVFLPLPYYIEKPGSTIDLSDVITVNQKTTDEAGSFSLTSVGVQQASLVTALKAKVSSYEDLMTKEEFLAGADSKEYEQMQNYYMKSSQNAAISQALKLADRPYKFSYEGVYVMSILADSNFKNKINIGDTVTAVDGHSFKNNQAFMNYVQAKNIDDEVNITVLQDSKEKTVNGELIKLPKTNKAGIGITLVDHTEVESKDKIEFKTDNIGGPSAGLMFTLEIYDQLTKRNLTQGKKIAGTGTIDDKGAIGRIGGIDKKVVSADKKGVEIFFAPDDKLSAAEKKIDPKALSNYQEAKQTARQIDSKMKIVPVKTLTDALDYLENM